MIPGGYGGFDLQGSMRGHHSVQPMNPAQQHPHPSFPLTICSGQTGDQNLCMGDHHKGEKGKSSLSDEDEPSFNEEGGDGHGDAHKGKKGSPWQRVKWTDKMVKLLITAVSYIGEDSASDCGSRRKFAVLQKKGKWKSVSKVMAERGYHVSPQQCEDKFNDLNKRYKKLNDMLGRGTSCQVVENPALLDVIDYLTEKEKDDVRKILSSKHLFYEEMCSYHNGNRLHLPHDPALQRSLHLALRSRDDNDSDDFKRHLHEDVDDEDQQMEADDHDEYEESHGDGRGIYGALGGPSKRPRQGQGSEDSCFHSALNSQDGSKGPYAHPHMSQTDMNQSMPEGAKVAWTQKQWIDSRSLQLEEQKLQIQVEMLELEKQRFRWQWYCQKRDRELEKMRMENERMKLENERMALELKRRELGPDS